MGERTVTCSVLLANFLKGSFFIMLISCPLLNTNLQLYVTRFISSHRRYHHHHTNRLILLASVKEEKDNLLRLHKNISSFVLQIVGVIRKNISYKTQCTRIQPIAQRWQFGSKECMYSISHLITNWQISSHFTTKRQFHMN